MKANKKKKFKGMTLIEIIVSLAIVSIMTTVLVLTSAVINSYMRSSNDVNNRVAQQAPVAEAQDKFAADQSATVGLEILIEGDISLHANSYAVYDSAEMAAHSDEFGAGLNMKFIADIETTTAPAP
ncbi:MAG: type II secretion system GspH family protein [Alistipes sp.]|nr:type II secretion system GspH family protein [Alistipes sp.]